MHFGENYLSALHHFSAVRYWVNTKAAGLAFREGSPGEEARDWGRQ